MTDDNIKEVINRTCIVDIINATIPLKKKGNNYFGLSPFKNEKTPSFSVNEEKKIFHCFSTGEHGNVIDFLIKVKGYDFKDALHELASKAGVELSYRSSKINSIIYEINDFSKELFHSNLFQSKVCMQIKDKKSEIFLVYPQGNYIKPSDAKPYLIIGEINYGKPILDRILTPQISLGDASRCALISMDSTIRSDLRVGPPIDFVVYKTGLVEPVYKKQFDLNDPEYSNITTSWSQSIIRAFETFPRFTWEK